MGSNDTARGGYASSWLKTSLVMAFTAGRLAGEKSAAFKYNAKVEDRDRVSNLPASDEVTKYPN